jgi:hypothetical protein
VNTRRSDSDCGSHCGGQREYLSGFSKRKRAKKDAAKQRNDEKERLERNEIRAQVRLLDLPLDR